jgi:L-threonylcarbamoyladenylate synthase
VVELSQYGISAAQVAHAAGLIRQGRLVAFPTETVYGLGANALDPAAVERIYEAKGRPHSSPIIIHISDLEMLHQVVSEWPETAQKLAETFWPGPLTLVLPRTAAVPDLVTAGLPTVGVRMPAHPIALELVSAAEVPIAAPSANRFTEISPTTAQHVRDSLRERVDYILDGGPCSVGIESTVLTLAEGTPRILRPGGVSRAEIEAVIGKLSRGADTEASASPFQRAIMPGFEHINTEADASLTEGDGIAHASPGMHPRHYSPRTPLYLIENGKVNEEGRGAYLQLSRAAEGEPVEVVVMPSDPVGYAAKLYEVLHLLDVGGFDWIAVETPPDLPGWEAVRDRLRRAAGRE